MVKLAKKQRDQQIYRQTYRYTDKPIDIHIHNTKNTKICYNITSPYKSQI